MTITFVRTIILYLLVIFAFRLMGKRQVGELSPSELVVAMMISDLAALPAHDSNIPLLSGVIPILSLTIIEIMLSFFSLKSRRIRRWLSGSPVVLVRHGKIVEEELEKLRFNLDDLLQELRQAGYVGLSEVDFMMLEKSGKVSVIPKAASATVRPTDLGLSPKQETCATLVISDGKLCPGALHALGLDEKWVYHVLKKHKIKHIKDCLVLTADEDKNVYLQAKSEVKEK